MKKYEYKIVAVEPKGIVGGKMDIASYEKDLNGMGADGWELVGTMPVAQSYGSTSLALTIFKREISG